MQADCVDMVNILLWIRLFSRTALLHFIYNSQTTFLLDMGSMIV